MKDARGREISYLRISVTDRCNLRCKYCMPEGIACVEHNDILRFEEIRQIAECAARLGITRIRLTGGEPLARKGCSQLVKMLKDIPGIKTVAMTTNGTLLRANLPQLLEAGLDAVNISLDTLDAARFASITGQDLLKEVLAAMDASLAAGLDVRINAVSMPDTDWKKLILLAKDRSLDVRFIELMPIGEGRRSAGQSNEELLAQVRREFPGLQTDDGIHGAGPAVYYRIPGYQGSIGFISAMHGKFCSSCNRVRLTSTGFLKTCLCYEDGTDLRRILRGEQEEPKQPDGHAANEKANEKIDRQQPQVTDSNNQKLLDAMAGAIYGKPAEHCFDRPDQITEAHGMNAIGG